MKKTGQEPLTPKTKALLVKSASYASLATAIALVGLKAWGWNATDSVSLLSSLADSVLDVLASSLTFWAVRFSLSPADAEHRFGHGKSEGLAALCQSVIIAGSGLYVCFEALQRFIVPQPINAPATGIIVIVIATVATSVLVGFQHFVGRRTGSVAITADAAHYKMDVLINLGVLIAILITMWTGWSYADPLVGFGVGLYILWNVAGIARRSLDILLDHEIPRSDREQIRSLALGHPDVRGFHDMRTRFGGNNYIVQFHLELDPDITLYHSHEILDRVEDRIRKHLPGCEIIIHADPLGYPERRDPFEQT